MGKARKTRSDIKVGNLEKKLGLGAGAIKNPDGTDARSDKKLGTLRKQFAKAKVTKKTATNSKATGTKTAVRKTATTIDEKKAAKRTVKSNPKATSRLAKKVSTAIKKTIK